MYDNGEVNCAMQYIVVSQLVCVSVKLPTCRGGSNSGMIVTNTSSSNRCTAQWWSSIAKHGSSWMFKITLLQHVRQGMYDGQALGGECESEVWEVWESKSFGGHRQRLSPAQSNLKRSEFKEFNPAKPISSSSFRSRATTSTRGRAAGATAECCWLKDLAVGS
jgi:hypothetical protein